MASLVSVLFGALLGMTGTLLLTQDDRVRQVPARTEAAPVKAPAKPAEPAISRCADLVLPARPTERVACRTSKALLQIVGQSKPLVVGGTMVRVLSARREGSSVLVRLRVRNETPAEQGVQAGGQELYLNVGGRRVDSYRLSAVRIPPHSGRTVRLRFRLSMDEIAALRASGGAAELGVRPWEGSTVVDRVVGVIRLRVRTAPR